MVAVTFVSVVLAVHIAAVVVTFGVIFAYPLIYSVAAKHPEHLPYTYRLEYEIGRKIIQPGLLVLILAGIYLASEQHVWGEAWVDVPIAIALILGGMGGMLFTPTERKLVDVAERDVAASVGGEIRFSAEHDALVRRVQIGGAVAGLLVLVAIFFMTAKPFA